MKEIEKKIESQVEKGVQKLKATIKMEVKEELEAEKNALFKISQYEQNYLFNIIFLKLKKKEWIEGPSMCYFYKVYYYFLKSSLDFK